MKRRHFLQAAGLTLTLPAVESLGGAADLEDSTGVKRLLLMTDGYGFYTPNLPGIDRLWMGIECRYEVAGATAQPGNDPGQSEAAERAWVAEVCRGRLGRT